MDDKEIKPCPFCGERANLSYTLGRAYITCSNTNCKVHPSTWLSLDTNRIDKLVATWNKRM